MIVFSWLGLLLLNVSIGCVSHFFQDASFFSLCFNQCFRHCCGFLTFPCLWEISFSSQMIVELLVSHWVR